jgi:F420 biosynthesis protein FbiB-like protein
MEVMQAISDRRSIRRFEDRPVGRHLIETVLDAAVQAPSGKNAQPWRFVVLQGAKKDGLVDAMEKQVNSLNEAGFPTGSAAWTAKAMRQAPVLILVFDANWTPGQDRSGLNRYGHLVDTQSIGAAVQNMLLVATSLGLGSLWICDVFYADRAIGELTGVKEELVAAVSLGYAAESPGPRPRKPWQEVTAWLE